MASVVGIFLYEREGEQPTSVDTARFDSAGSLSGDRHRTKPGRKILMVDRGVLEDRGLAPGALREQLTVEGLPELYSLPAGTRLMVGSASMEVLKPCAPCLIIGQYNGAEDPEAFRQSIEGRRGMFVEFVGDLDQSISVGDEVRVVEKAEAR
jgi:hypothetical protein